MLGRYLPALAMAPAEILSGKIVSAYVPRGRPPALPAMRPELPWAGVSAGGESLWGAPGVLTFGMAAKERKETGVVGGLRGALGEPARLAGGVGL